MFSFACENIHQSQERINDELCFTHRGILRTEESNTHRGAERSIFAIKQVGKYFSVF